MAMQMGALRDALMNPGDEAKAIKAAEEMANYQSEFTTIKIDLAIMKGDLYLVKWMLGPVLGIVIAVAFKIFLL